MEWYNKDWESVSFCCRLYLIWCEVFTKSNVSAIDHIWALLTSKQTLFCKKHKKMLFFHSWVSSLITIPQFKKILPGFMTPYRTFISCLEVCHIIKCLNSCLNQNVIVLPVNKICFCRFVLSRGCIFSNFVFHS